MTVLLLVFACTSVRAQSLDSLIETLRRDNPELRAYTLDYQAALTGHRQVDRLPDLELGAGVFVLPIQTRTGPQQFRLSATQMLPWPGKLAAMAELADARARPLLEEVALRQSDLVYDLSQAYYELAGTEARTRVLRENLELYASLRELALARVANGRGSSVDVYRIQLRVRELERRIEESNNEAALARVRINTLLDRPTDVPVSTPGELSRAATEALLEAPHRVDAPAGLDDYAALNIFALRQRIAEQAITANDLDARPDFGIGLDYIATGRRQDVEVPMNGRDVLMVRGMVSLPLSRRRYDARREEEQLRIQSLDSRREALRRRLVGELRRALLQIEDAGKQLDFLDEQLTVIAATLDIARAEYANAAAGQGRRFDELITLQNEALGLRTRAVAAQTRILTQAALLDRYLPKQ